MAHPYHHALSSLRQWGGSVEDYQRIHGWFDESKMIIADFRHRALRHHARSEEHTSELQSQSNLVCRLLLEKKKKIERHNNVSENVFHVKLPCNPHGFREDLAEPPRLHLHSSISVFTTIVRSIRAQRTYLPS